MPAPLAEKLARAGRQAQAGDLAAAERIYDELIAAHPDHPAVLYGLGVLRSRQSRFEAAIDLLERAVALDPSRPIPHYALGNVFLKAERVDRAIDCFRRAVTLQPDFVDAHNNLGQALFNAGRVTEAAAACDAALRRKPDHVPALINLGNALRKLGRIDDAVERYRRAIALAPKSILAHRNLASALLFQRDYDGAIEHFEQALVLRPEADDLRLHLAGVLLTVDRIDEALALYAAALERDPTLLEARWRMRLALPVLNESEAQIDEVRAGFERGLDELIAEVNVTDPAVRRQALAAINGKTNFFLNYHGRVDRPLQEKYGRLVHAVLAAEYPQWGAPRPMPAVAPDERIRIGFVSSHFFYHAATRLALSFLTDGDRGRFEYCGYDAGQTHDDYTDRFRAACALWRHAPDDLEALAAAVVEDAPHVLIYTDIGMVPLMMQLAALRLAPVQCMLWGHPITSGLPTMDYFLSSDLMEPSDGEAHYSETLIRLPNLGVRYVPPPVPDTPRTRAEFDLPPPDEAVVYLSCQSMFKYLPQHDHLFVEIAQRVPNAVFVFIGGRRATVTERFRERLAAAFTAAGLSPDAHIRLFETLDSRTDYPSLHLACDVYLDTLDWSGGNTTIEALYANLPVVTLPGALMRARHSYAMLRMLEIDETIAGDKTAYVDIAARLGNDLEFRGAVKARVASRLHRIFDDESPVRALEAHIESWVR